MFSASSSFLTTKNAKFIFLISAVVLICIALSIVLLSNKKNNQKAIATPSSSSSSSTIPEQDDSLMNPQLKSSNVQGKPKAEEKNVETKQLSTLEPTTTAIPTSTSLIQTTPTNIDEKISSSLLLSCTDDDILRGFFGCKCGIDTLITENINGPCLFGQLQRQLPETRAQYRDRMRMEMTLLQKQQQLNATSNQSSSFSSLFAASSPTAKGTISSTAPKLVCQDEPIRIAILGDEIDFRSGPMNASFVGFSSSSTTNRNNNNNDNFSTSAKTKLTTTLHGGFVTPWLYYRRKSLMYQCYTDEEQRGTGAVEVVPRSFFGYGFESQFKPSKQISTRFFTSKEATSTIVDFQNSAPLRKSLLFRPHIAVLNLGANEYFMMNIDDDKNENDGDRTFQDLLFEEYSKVIKRLIEYGSLQRLIVLTPPPPPPPSSSSTKSSSSSYEKQLKFLEQKVVPVIRKIASDAKLNSLFRERAHKNAKIILVDVFDAFRKFAMKNDEKTYRNLFASVSSSIKTNASPQPQSSRAVLSKLGNIFVANLTQSVICTKCTKEAKQDMIPWLKKKITMKRENDDGNDDDPETTPSIAATTTTSTQTTTICPPGSTVDGVWGLNDPGKYFSTEFYEKEKEKPEQEHDIEFGKWITTTSTVNTMMMNSSRSDFLNLLCRQEGDNSTSASSPCDFKNKPSGFTPFAGPFQYSVKRTVAYYRPTDSSSFDSLMKRYEISSSSSSSSSSSTFCYDYQDPTKCLRNKIILFIGDSHVLNMAQMTCRMLLLRGRKGEKNKNNSSNSSDEEEKITKRFGGPCGGFDIRFTRPLTTVHIAASNTTIAMFRLRYNISNQMNHRFFKHPWHKVLLQSDFIFITRGMWDIVYRDTPNREVFEEYRDTLKYLARTFVRARIIVKLLHFDHKRLWNCATPKRMRDIRDVQVCAVSRADTDTVDADGERELQKSRFSIFDSYGMTKKLPYKDVGDLLGHHYQGSIQESLVQMMFSIMCPPQPQNFNEIVRMREKYAKVACGRLFDDDGLKEEKPNFMCGCANKKRMKNKVPENVTKFCNLLRSWNPVPFAVDV